jgi:peptidoglycan/xylan/chitin deacetylase (PgdA/CDA1 family)
MSARPFGQGKHELLARGLLWSGATVLTRTLPERDVLLVLNYHRIAVPDRDPFDPGVFSASRDQFYEQIAYLKRRVSLVTLQEAMAFVEGADRAAARHCRVLITFDDGYLDNYQAAFPILKSLGVQGVFFLVTSLVGTSHVPWWDHIAYVLRTAQRRRFLLRYPADLAVDLDAKGFTPSLNEVFGLYKLPSNTEPVRFVSELQQEARGEEPPRCPRRFLDWSEAREMVSGGMAIGSHTHSHAVLTQLGPEQQLSEMGQSRLLLSSELGIEAEALAYPVGAKATFSDETQQVARDVGYRVAFSAHGGTNLPGATSRYDVKRVGIDNQSSPRFKVQAAICRITGSYWP